jgi:hypothetical protein
MLGHASAAMTQDVHSGLFDDDLDGVCGPDGQGSCVLTVYYAGSGIRCSQVQHESNPFCHNRIGLVGQQGLEPWTDGL